MIYRLIGLAAIAAGLLAALSGCVCEEGHCADAPSGGIYRMSITVYTSLSAATRAGHSDDREEQGSDPENQIDFAGGDFRLVLFDAAGVYLYEVEGMDQWKFYPAYQSDNYWIHMMEGEIRFPETIAKERLAALQTSGFRIMVLANWQRVEGHNAYGSLEGWRSGKTLTDIWKDGTNHNFHNFYTASGTTTWLPDHSAEPKKLIPMFGIAQAAKFERRTSGGEFYSSASIPMQRAVAKIEVIDNLQQQPGLRVSDVKMTQFNTAGRFIPDVAANPAWDQIGSQVESSSVPVDPDPRSGLQFVQLGQGVWTAYVPEMNLGGNITDARPHLEVQIDNTNAPTGGYTGGTYPLHFAKYDDRFEPTIPDKSWEHLLRNHIYRFSIDKVGLTLQLHLHVIPWYEDADEVWDFTDHVTVGEPALAWMPDTFDSITPTEEGGNDLVLKLDGTLLKGTLDIRTPQNGRWYARLTPIGEAKPNAVSFVDQAGNVLDPSAGEPKACVEISGTIDGSKQVFYLRPTNFENDSESRFKLDFWVENLGVWMNVPTPAYTIVRKANIIE